MTWYLGRQVSKAGLKFKILPVYTISFFKQTLTILQQINVENSIQYTVLGFELTTLRRGVSSHNH